MNAADTERAATNCGAPARACTWNGRHRCCAFEYLFGARARKRVTRVNMSSGNGTINRRHGLRGAVESKRFKNAPDGYMVVGTQATDAPAVCRTERGQVKDRCLTSANGRCMGDSPVEETPYVAFVPIIEGCNEIFALIA